MTNIDDVLDDCGRQSNASALLERKRWPAKSARTDVACFETSFYRSRISGAFRECDDTARVYIENVVRRHVEGALGLQVFRHHPERIGINGSKGVPIKNGFAEKLKIELRNAFFHVDPRFRYF